jgi:hypothetical protein
MRKIEDYLKRCCPFVSSHPLSHKKPINTIVIIWVIAVIDAVPPTFISFLKLNSRPRLNSNIITFCPDFNTLYVFTDGKKSKWVPARKPAIKIS